MLKKFVEKAASKKPVGILNGLKSSDINPRLVFHYGIPAGSVALAYDSVQKILAISTKDGRIKLFGKDNTQALLESHHPAPTKFMQFLENQGVLINVTVQNHIEVWDIESKQLCHVQTFKEEITSITVIRDFFYMYVGCSTGNISILKLDQETYHLVQMIYNIPVAASHGNTTEEADAAAVLYIMPQPMAESKRVLIIYRDGLIVLWGLEESKVTLIIGGNALLSLSNETKKVTSACWACPFGSKVVVGYNNGEIYIWSIPPLSNPKCSSQADKEFPAAQNVPLCKLNLGYKMVKIPILSLKWVYGDGKASRLYVNGTSGSTLSNSFQIVLLNEQTESRTVKLALPLPEPCLDMELISTSEQNKQKQDSLLILLKSGRLCTYDDSMIEKYLLHSQSKSPPPIPKEVMAKLPFADSSITIAKFIADDSNFPIGTNEEYNLLAKNLPALFSTETRGKDGTHLSGSHFNGLVKIKNLYITGHSDGTINFWDVSCPFLLPITSVKQQGEDGNNSSGLPLTALYFDNSSKILVSGDQSGMVRIIRLKPELFSAENNLLVQGNTKKGDSSIIHTIKLIKVNGVVLSISINRGSKLLAVGSDQGYVSVIDMEGPTVLYQKVITSELCTDINSLQFGTCNLHGFEKNILLVATKDSSVMALESDSGSTLSPSTIHPNKLSKALFMQILDVPDGVDLSKGNSVDDAVTKNSLLLLCNEKAVYLYSLVHAVQGTKKVLYKKKFQGSLCCWASTFFNWDSGVAVVLLFSSGKLEIRSLPELSLLKETSISGLTFSNSKLNSYSDSSLCSSVDGEIVLVNGDQEVLFVSLLLRKEIYRFLDPITDVYKKGVIAPKKEFLSAAMVQKEKKKGIFSSVIKDIKGNKSKKEPEPEVKNGRESVADDLSTIFSTANFPLDTENNAYPVVDDDDVELNIDDIDLGDLGEKPKEKPGEKPKAHNMIAALQNQKFGRRFQALTGKLKEKMVKNEKVPAKVDNEDENTVAVDQIKKRYGFSSSSTSELSAAKLAESKLQENAKKLQGINVKAMEMQDTAQSFSAMAKDMLRIRTAENDRRNSSS